VAIYKLAAKAVWLGEVEAPDETAAIEKGAAEFRVPPSFGLRMAVPAAAKLGVEVDATRFQMLI
jgi:hypothetical protein